MTNQTICKICDKSVTSVGQHARMAHKIKPQEYYDTFLKEPTDGICIVCNGTTRYVDTNRGYKKYCSNLCSTKDKDLQKIKTQSYMDTLAGNPSINIQRGKAMSATWKNNPELAEQRLATRKKTLADNPNILIARNISASISLRNFYNKRKELGDTLPYQMYLLQHTEKDIIKIGITKDLSKRISELRRDFGDIECIHAIDGPYSTIAKLEQSLHNHFNKYCEVQPTGGGRTEWFNSTITNEVLSMMVLD